MTDVDRPLANEASERCVLALCLRTDNGLEEALALGVGEDHFYRIGNRAIWAAMVADRKAGRAMDEATVMERLEPRVGSSSGVWGDHSELWNHLTHIRGSSVRRSMIQDYVTGMEEMRVRRCLLDAATSLLEHHSSGATTSQLQSVAQAGLLAAAESLRGQPEAPMIGALVEEALMEALDIAEGRKPDRRLRTGIRSLDSMLTQGTQPGSYVILAGRPSMGKTQMALGWLKEWTARGPTHLCSVEMNRTSLGRRVASSEMELDYEDADKLRAGMARVATEWGTVPLTVDAQCHTLQEVLTSIRVAKQKRGIVACAVDYLQLIRLPRADTREQQVAHASREFALLADQLDIVMVLLSQLNRGVEHRSDKRPMMADLRESGAMEQDADCIVGLYRDFVYNPSTENPWEAEAIVLKQRNGPTGTAFCHFRPGGWFRDLALVDEQQATMRRLRA